MLPRAALRATRPPAVSSQAFRPTLASGLAVALRSERTYASDGRPKRPPPPPPQKSRPAAPRPPTPPKPGSARQTSPGTSFPKDKSWKPQDGIKFDGPGAATPTGAGAAASAAESPLQGSRPEDSTARPSSPLEGGSPQEPVAQRRDADEPVVGGIRDATQNAQAAAENTPPPPEPPAEPEAPSQPLPDLRQGIPSTFAAEYMSGKQQDTTEGQGEQAQTDNFDVEPTAPEEGRKERRERDYDGERYETSMDKRRAANFYYLYLSIFGVSVLGAAYLGRPFGSKEEIPAGLSPEDASSWSPSSMYTRVRARMGNQLGYYTEPTFPKLLPEVPEGQRPPFTLVLSLEDLMIHSSWDREHGWRVSKRPGIDYFIRYLSQYYELVLFTSVPISIADPVIKKLDPFHFIMWPLGREATKYEKGEYIKDLEYLNRPLSKTLIIDTHAPHVKNQPENAIILPKWGGDPKDPHTKDLVGLIPFLEYVATMGTDDVRNVIKSFDGQHIPVEFARREGEARKKFNEQLAVERSKAPKRSLGSLFGSSLGIKPTPGMGGGMVLADGQSVAEGLAQGKMLSDQIREQGQKQYEFLEKQIRENGAQWLKEEEEEQKKMIDAQMKEMKTGAFSWFGGGKKD